MINKVLLIGNLGKDPHKRTLDNGNTVMNFSLATNENYKDKNGEWQTVTEWHNIVFWGDRELSKGDMIYVEGKLQTRKWQDKDGNDKYTTEVVARVIRMIKSNESKPTASQIESPGGLPF